MLAIGSANCYAQKWEPGRFTDIKGEIEKGFIRVNPPGKGPIKNEGFIEFKEDEKANPYPLSASDIHSFVAGKDSFVVARAPGGEEWAKNQLDFVKVELDEDIKLYVTKGGKGGGRGSGFGITPGVGIGTGIGTGGGGFGAGVDGGIAIPIGGGGNGGKKTIYYFGENTASMKRLTNENFEDTMADIMGDYPEVVDKIHAKVYVLANIDRLIAYFKQVKAAEK